MQGTLGSHATLNFSSPTNNVYTLHLPIHLQVALHYIQHAL